MLSRWSRLAAVVLAAMLFAPFAAASIPSAADLALAPRALPELASTSIEATIDPGSCGVFCQRLEVRLEAGLFGGGEPHLVALDAWGNYRNPAELEASKNRFGFTGHLFDREADLLYAQARYYDPEHGRFLSQDAFAGAPDDPPSLHKYAYARNQPTLYSDPDGNVAIVDNVAGGVVSMALGYGIAKLTGQDYSLSDAAVDFGLGAATSGLSALSKIKALANLGKGAQFGLRAGAEVGLDVGAEVIRHELKGQDYDVGDLIEGGGQNFLIGEGGSRIGGRLLKAGRRWLGHADEVAEAGALAARRADRAGVRVEGDAGELAKPRVGGEVDAGARPSMAPGTPANPVDRRFTRAELREKYRYAEGTLGKSRAEARAMIESGQLCFRAGTLVHTLSGLKPIEAIEVGDLVLSRDVENDRLEYQKVVQTFRRQAEFLLEMTILGEEGAPLGVTAEHPFYARRARDNLATGNDAPTWIAAGDLRPGDLVQRPDGSWTLILQIRRIAGAAVFNFEVERNHNYYVGQQGALTHNSCVQGAGAPGGQSAATIQNAILFRRYLREIEGASGFAIGKSQRRAIFEHMKTGGANLRKLSPAEADAHRWTTAEREALIAEWEARTGQAWPRYTADKVSRSGTAYIRKGTYFDAHEIIPNQFAGPHAWWNLMPLERPNQHQAVVHGKASAYRQILKRF